MHVRELGSTDVEKSPLCFLYTLVNLFVKFAQEVYFSMDVIFFGFPQPFTYCELCHAKKL